jgi:hypothetical protein
MDIGRDSLHPVRVISHRQGRDNAHTGIHVGLSLPSNNISQRSSRFTPFWQHIYRHCRRYYRALCDPFAIMRHVLLQSNVSHRDIWALLDMESCIHPTILALFQQDLSLSSFGIRIFEESEKAFIGNRFL